jgi:hypothetical protein
MNPLVILLIILISVAVLSASLYFIGTYASKPSGSSNSGMQPVNAQASVTRCPYGECHNMWGTTRCHEGTQCNPNTNCCDAQ